MPTDEPQSPLLSGPANEYLREMLSDIAVMLDFASSNGIALSDELHSKIDSLVNDPNVKQFDMFHSHVGRR